MGVRDGGNFLLPPFFSCAEGLRFVAVLLFLSAIGGPLLAVFWKALGGTGEAWAHLLRFVVPSAARTTFLLLGGVGFVTAVIGVGTAFLISFYRFPGCRFLEIALLLPLAVPAYVMAYASLDWFDPTGPLQSFVEIMTGAPLPASLLPEMRSLKGGVAVMSFVLYPYVYLTCRASFLMQSDGVFHAARSLGAQSWRVFFQIALPLVRPALVVGLALVMMEGLNDIGVAKIYGLRTLTFSVYETWLNRNNLPGAAQIACGMLGLVFLLLWAERLGRHHQRYYGGTRHAAPLSPALLPLSGWSAGAAFFVCALPFLLGFVLPALTLLNSTLVHFELLGASVFLSALRNTLLLSFLGAGCTVILGVVLALWIRSSKSTVLRNLVQLSCLGYAIPGTILALGVLTLLAGVTQQFQNGMALLLGGTVPSLFFSGTLFALVYAYVLRFLALAVGTLRAGLSHIPPHLTMAARSLGATATETLLRIQLPLLRPALFSAGLLVFMECMKELPATMLLRPFDFETLATLVYSAAARESIEEGAPAALVLLLAGLPLILLLLRAGRPSSQGGSSSSRPSE